MERRAEAEKELAAIVDAFSIDAAQARRDRVKRQSDADPGLHRPTRTVQVMYEPKRVGPDQIDDHVGTRGVGFANATIGEKKSIANTTTCAKFIVPSCSRCTEAETSDLRMLQRDDEA